MQSESKVWCILVSFYIPIHETLGINDAVCEEETGGRSSLESYHVYISG